MPVRGSRMWVFGTCVCVVCLKASVMNLVLVVLWSLATPFCRFRPMASCLSTVWVCVIIICKMLYQLSVVNPEEYSRNCSTVSFSWCHAGTSAEPGFQTLAGASSDLNVEHRTVRAGIIGRLKVQSLLMEDRNPHTQQTAGLSKN